MTSHLTPSHRHHVLQRRFAGLATLLLGTLLLATWPVAATAATLAAPPAGRADEAAPEERRRAPPRPAIAACTGREEGSSCSFPSRHGVLEGVCLSGNDGYFACRPHRDEPRPQRAAPPPGHTTPPQVLEAPAATTPPPVTTGNATARHFSPTELAAFALVAALAATAGTWLVLFRATTVPLRRLRKVTQQLAGGDLSARVGEGLVHRKSEVVALGRDVDRMAERIESLVGAHQRLVRDVSHELRSPLARLNVALELARSAAGPHLAAPFERIERESARLNELIGQLLVLTKLESQGAMKQLCEFDLLALAGEIVQDADFEARNNQRQVVMTTTGSLLMRGNRELVRQALENLIRNAARYTEEGTAVEVVVRRGGKGTDGWVQIQIVDHGPGVPESELNDIFRPFYRVNDARERQSGGAGVGLAIAERAIQLHGGSVRATNAAGGGLVMEVKLPLSPAG